VSTLKELRQVRLDKIKQLQQLGVDPYPAHTQRTAENGQIASQFDQFEGQPVTVVGRITSMRGHGSLAFYDLKDASGSIQLYIKQEQLQPADHSLNQLNYDELGLLDLGDFIEATGTVVKTKRGEISVETTAIRLLTKALRQMPNAWDGLKDKETRMRRRYLDTAMNQQVFDRYVRRAKFWQAHRDFLNQRGFLEINIPVLEAVTGGADAKPFVTHMDALDSDFYLRISQELYLKRLIGGGYEKVYEIGPRFRNEGLSDEHLPEHMAMEFYWAYADYHQGMEFVQQLFRHVAQAVYGTLQFTIHGHQVDLGQDWQIIEYADIIKQRFGIDIYHTSLDEVKQALRDQHQPVDSQLNLNRGLDQLWKVIRPTLSGPAFMIHEPTFLSPLAKSVPGQPHVSERIHPIIAGSELGNGYSELNDPQDQLQRFMEQQKLRESGDDEAQMLDIDFVEMLEYGMPPTFGWGHSERVFWFLEDVPAREGVPFPQLKHEVDDVTRSIYPELFPSNQE
jgi:lysyl-tRNA synthetase class 2